MNEMMFHVCPTCGLEWRRGATNCPGCVVARWMDKYAELVRDFDELEDERDLARDWCRKLVAVVRAYRLFSEDARLPYRLAALPPELRAAIEEAK